MDQDRSELQARINQIRAGLIDAVGMPEWRQPLPAVDELVSTILSQNTNDTNRDVAFWALKEAFLDWQSVMNANTQDVIKAIHTAGLANQKGPRIQKALQEIADHNNDEISLDFLRAMPKEEAREWLTEVNGVGPKTAAIVLQFSLGIPAFPVDTHIYRVTGRMGLRPSKMSVEKAHAYLEELIPEEAYYDLHLNLIRLGREVCGARKWHCYRCPVENLCDFNQKNITPV
jgi:endonuclease-3